MSTTSLLQKSINRFNKLAHDPFEGSLYMLPQTLACEEAADLDTLRTWEIVSTCPHSFSHPAETVCQLIDDLNLKTRAVEEIQHLKKDMLSVVDHYQDEHKSLQQQLIMHDNQDHCIHKVALLFLNIACYLVNSCLSKLRQNLHPSLHYLNLHILLSFAIHRKFPS